MRALNQITLLQLVKYRGRLSEIPIEVWQKIKDFAHATFALDISMFEADDRTTLVMHMPSCKHPIDNPVTNDILRFFYQNSSSCFSDAQLENIYRNMQSSFPLLECSYAMVDVKDDGTFGNGKTYKVARLDAKWNSESNEHPLSLWPPSHKLNSLLDACFKDFHFDADLDFYTSSFTENQSKFQWRLIVWTQPKKPYKT